MAVSYFECSRFQFACEVGLFVAVYLLVENFNGVVAYRKTVGNVNRNTSVCAVTYHSDLTVIQNFSVFICNNCGNIFVITCFCTLVIKCGCATAESGESDIVFQFEIRTVAVKKCEFIFVAGVFRRCGKSRVYIFAALRRGCEEYRGKI